jgi:hypothetical protein
MYKVDLDRKRHEAGVYRRWEWIATTGKTDFRPTIATNTLQI